MVTQLLIDGTDAYTAYNLWAEDGALGPVIEYPPLKAPETNDWHEEDGLEVDLTAPRLDTRTFQLRLATSRAEALLTDFYTDICDGAYHEWEFRNIARRYRLRVTAFPEYTCQRGLARLTVTLADDFPLRGYTYRAPVQQITDTSRSTLDRLLTAQYSLRFLNGTNDAILRHSDPKTNLLTDIKTRAGVTYDPQAVTLKSRDITLPILLRANSLGNLFRNYDALLYNLTRTGLRTLYYEPLEAHLTGYYLRAVVREFYPQDRWLRLDLTLRLTKPVTHLTEADTLLAAEDGTPLTDGQTQQQLIDISQ